MAEETKSSPANGGGLSLRVRGPRDFYGGLFLVALAAFALWAGSDLSGMRGFSFGPGTAPRLFAWLLILVGAAISISGLFVDGPPLESYALRGPAYVICAIIIFAVTIRGFRFTFFGSEMRIPEFGLVVATFLAFMMAALGAPRLRLLESLLAGIAMTLFCVALFRYLLQLPFPLWPNF
ncbi:MAG: tripartite tricarboxylate transporter TctB family protein [Pseudolabrys sp.]|jgi:putative tricarboxylic transport membrane protein